MGGLLTLLALVLWELVSSDKERVAARHDDSPIHNFFLPNEAELVIQGIVCELNLKPAVELCG